MRLSRLRTSLLAAALALFLAPASASAETILRYTDHEPLGGMRTRFLNDVFFAAVETESKGRLKIKASWDSAVATGYDALRVIGRGEAADMAVVVPEYSDRTLPLHQLFKSFPRGPAGEKQVAFLRRAYADIPAFAAEMKANNSIVVFIATGYPLAFFSTKPMPGLADVKASRWRTASFWHRDFLRNAGATPVTMPWGVGVFDALKAGTLDGLMVNIDSGAMLKVHEVAPHVLASRDLWLGHVYLVAVNADAYAALSQEDKDAIARAAEVSYRTLGDVMDRSFAAMVDDLKKEGAQVRLLGDGEVRGFEAAVRYEDAQTAWVEAETAKGVKGLAETLARLRALLADALR